VSDAKELRDKASKARRLAAAVMDAKARDALETLSRELDQQAAEIERRDVSNRYDDASQKR
jgi:hypothetical protein